jgi:hypothetical protein
MTDTAGTQSDATPDTLPPTHTIVQMLLRALASSAVLVMVYYLLPLDHSSRGLAITMLVIGLVLLTGLITVQVRWVATSPYPRLRAIEALATSVPLAAADADLGAVRVGAPGAAGERLEGASGCLIVRAVTSASQLLSRS